MLWPQIRRELNLELLLEVSKLCSPYLACWLLEPIPERRIPQTSSFESQHVHETHKALVNWKNSSERALMCELSHLRTKGKGSWLVSIQTFYERGLFASRKVLQCQTPNVTHNEEATEILSKDRGQQVPPLHCLAPGCQYFLESNSILIWNPDFYIITQGTPLDYST